MLFHKIQGAGGFGGADGAPAYFGSTSNSSTGGDTSLSLTLPSSIPSGATIYVIGESEIVSGTGAFDLDTSGYTQIALDQAVGGDNDRAYGIWYKVSDGTETSISVSDSSSTYFIGAASIVITGGSGYGTYSLYSSSNTGTPDPASVSITASDSVVMIFYAGFRGSNDDISNTSDPTGYTNVVDLPMQTSRSGAIGVWYKEEVASGTEDPGSFTLSNNAGAYVYTVSHEA